MPLGHLHHLQMLDLNNNTLQGKIPALANCSKLTRLSMAWNQLTGEIPVDLPSRLEACKDRGPRRGVELGLFQISN